MYESKNANELLALPVEINQDYIETTQTTYGVGCVRCVKAWEDQQTT